MKSSNGSANGHSHNNGNSGGGGDNNDGQNLNEFRTFMTEMREKMATMETTLDLQHQRIVLQETTLNNQQELLNEQQQHILKQHEAMKQQKQEYTAMIHDLHSEIFQLKSTISDQHLVQIDLTLNTIWQNIFDAFIVIRKKYKIESLFVNDQDEKVKICTTLNIPIDELNNLASFWKECNEITIVLNESGDDCNFNGIQFGDLRSGITMKSNSITNFLRQFSEFDCNPNEAIDTINRLSAYDNKTDNEYLKNVEQKEDDNDENENVDNKGVISGTTDTKREIDTISIIDNQQEQNENDDKNDHENDNENVQDHSDQ